MLQNVFLNMRLVANPHRAKSQSWRIKVEKSTGADKPCCEAFKSLGCYFVFLCPSCFFFLLQKIFSFFSLTSYREPQSIMADALCGPSNALQSFQKQTSVDRTLQQDRIIARQAPAEVHLPAIKLSEANLTRCM